MKGIKVSLLLILMMFLLLPQGSALSPRSVLVGKSYSVSFSEGYQAKVYLTPWDDSLIKMTVKVFTPSGTDLKSRIVVFICPHSRILFIDRFYPDFIDRGIKGKGRDLLRKLLFRPAYLGFEILSKVSDPFMRSLGRMEGVHFVLPLDEKGRFYRRASKMLTQPLIQEMKLRYFERHQGAPYLTHHGRQIREWFWDESNIYGRINTVSGIDSFLLPSKGDLVLASSC